MKVAAVAAGAITIEAGTLRMAALLLRAMVPPPAFETVTVQAALCPAPSVAGLHDTAVTTFCVTSERAEEAELPFSDAVTAALWSAVIVPAAAVKTAVEAVEGTTTEAETVSEGVLLARETVAGPERDSVTVQELVCPAPSELGLHARPVTAGGGAERETDADLEAPFREAVTVTVWSAVTVPAVAVKAAVVAVEGTVTDGGTARTAELLLRVTVPPPVCDSVAVQELVPAEVKDAGEQASAVTVGSTGMSVSVPAVPATGRLEPSADDPNVFVTAMAAEVAPGESATFTVATTPFGIVDWFEAYRIQL